MNTTRAAAVTTRSYLTAGIAALGAGAIVLAPVQPLPDQAALVPNRVVSDLGTALLASSFDPITPWVDTITTSIDNIGALIGFAFAEPFPILQTIIANLGTYFGELTSGNAGLIPGQIFGNIGTFFQAPWSPGEVQTFPIGPLGSDNEVTIPNGTYLSEFPTPGNSPEDLNTIFNQFIVNGTLLIPACVDDGDCGIWPTVAAATTFLNSNASGVLLGLLGPVFSPVAALINSATAIIAAISDGDFIGAINEIVNIPANLVNGFLNGELLNLTPVLAALGLSLPVDQLGFRLGGLLTGPVPLNGSLNTPPTEFSGGTGLDALYIEANGAVFPGLPVGPIGSLIGMGQFLGQQLLVTPPVAPPAQTAATVQAPAPVEAAPVERVAAAEVIDARAAIQESDAAATASAEETAPAEEAAAVEVADARAAVQEAAAETAAGGVDGGATTATAGGDEAGPDPTQGSAEVSEGPTGAPARTSRTAPAATAADADAPRSRAAATNRR